MMPLAAEFGDFTPLSPDMRKVLSTLDEDAAPDVTGWSNGHLTPLAKCFAGGDPRAVAATGHFNWLCKELVNGRMPPWCHYALSAMVLVPIAKPGAPDEARPVAVGNVLRCAAWKAVTRASAEDARRILWPYNVGGTAEREAPCCSRSHSLREVR